MGLVKEILKKFTSRRFLLAVIFLVIVFLNAKFKLGLDHEALITLALVFGAFIGGESYKDAKQHEAAYLVRLAGEIKDNSVTSLTKVALKEFFRQGDVKSNDEVPADAAASDKSDKPTTA